MSRDDDTLSESEATTDRERIETWADEHEATPVRRERGDERTVELVPESERRDHHEELTWDDFHQELDENEMVVIRRNEESRPFDVLERDEMVSQSSMDAEDVEQRLMDGETITSTITETTVIEETVVEEATIESEVVDRAIVDETVVDAELITRDVDSCDVTEIAGDDDVDFGMFETGYESQDDIEVTVDVEEGWTVTKEILEQLTIESRIVDTDATETETVETDTFEEQIDVEGVQQTILEGDMLASEGNANEVIESGSIESEFREGQVIETNLMERRTVEEEMSVQREYTGNLTAGNTIMAETISSQDIESEIATDEDRELLGRDAMTETETTTTTDTTATTDTDTTTDTTATSDTTATTDTPSTTDTGTTAGTDTDTGMGGETAMPTDADEGKMVVDATGEEVGMVTDVEANTLYVDPHPSLTDRIKTVLDWGGHDDDAYPLEAENIAAITDDEVQLAGEEDLERT